MTPAGTGSEDDRRPPLLGFPAARASWDELVVGAANEAAIRLAGRPEAWATHALCVTGPAKCGLSWLAAAWAERFAGRYLSAAEFAGLKHGALDGLAEMPVAIDDADQLAGRRDDIFLSFLNIAGMRGGRVLLAAHRPPGQWRSESADLRSRLNAMPVTEIGPPDEAHYRARLAAAARQRFMKLSPETINYLVPRLELSYEAVEHFMDRLSGAVSEAGRAPGLMLARSVLEELDEDGEENDGAG